MPEPPPTLNYESLGDEDIKEIAWAQKVVVYCTLAQILTLISLPLVAWLSRPIGLLPPFAIPWLIEIALAVVYIAALVTGAAFVFRLAVALYGTGPGITFGVLCLIPCMGLAVLVSLNHQATVALRKSGVQVGLLGAKNSARLR